MAASVAGNGEQIAEDLQKLVRETEEAQQQSEAEVVEVTEQQEQPILKPEIEKILSGKALTEYRAH